MFSNYYKKPSDSSKKKVHALLMSYYKLKFAGEDKEEKVRWNSGGWKEKKEKAFIFKK